MLLTERVYSHTRSSANAQITNVEGALHNSESSLKVSVSILRLAITEMTYFEDIPYQVSINEAIELAKKYGDDDASSFVNGILDNIAKQ